MTAMTAAEKQRAYRARQAAANEADMVTPDGNGNAPIVTVTDTPRVTTIDPLSLYSPERWARMKAKGYAMPDGAEYDGQLTREGEQPIAVGLGYARRKIGPMEYVFLVPVPGDPNYSGQVAKASMALGTCEPQALDGCGAGRRTETSNL